MKIYKKGSPPAICFETDRGILSIDLFLIRTRDRTSEAPRWCRTVLSTVVRRELSRYLRETNQTENVELAIARAALVLEL